LLSIIGSPETVAGTLDIAGPGSRSYAFIIDWQYRALLALGWFCAAWVLIRFIGPASGGAGSSLQLRAAVAPALGPAGECALGRLVQISQ